MRAGPLLNGVWYLRNIYYLFKNLNLLYNSQFNEAQVSVLLVCEQVMFIVLRSIGSLERRCSINVFSQRNVIRKTLQASPSSVTCKIKPSNLHCDNLLVTSWISLLQSSVRIGRHISCFPSYFLSLFYHKNFLEIPVFSRHKFNLIYIRF